MASTYSNLKIELIGTGDQSGTWGVTTNTNLGTAIEEAITGSADVAFSSADVTLTLTNTNTSQTARNLRLNLTGTSGGARNLIVPAIEKQYIINNGLADAVTVKNSTGTGVAVPAGKSMFVFNTGSNVVEVVTALATGTVIPVANGGTGASTASITSFNNITGYTASGATGTTSTNLVFSGSPALTGTPTAPTAAGGTNTTQIATTAFVQTALQVYVQTALQVLYPVGSIYSSTVATNPATLFGFGTWVAYGAGRVLIGQSGVAPYVAGSTGGSADAVVVSHTHTLTDSGHSHNFDFAATSYGIQGGGSTIIANRDTGGAGTTTTSTTGITVATAGVSGTNANLQPYVVVYMWNRTA